MKKKIFYGVMIFGHITYSLYGTMEPEEVQQNIAEQTHTPDIYFLILDNAQNKQEITRSCSAPFSIQNYIDLYGPFTMATANNGQILDFNRNNITSLYGLQNITNYDVVAVRLIGNCIAGNTIDASFPDTPFQGLPNTQEIRFSQNQIESLPATFLSGLDQLAYLILGGNALSSFPFNFFSNHNLLYLGVANNHFSSLDTIDISNMQSLQNFILNGNYITTIPTDYFKNNPMIITIDVSKNSLSIWPATALNNCSYLASLNLSYNLLLDFQPDYIPENSSVILTGNPIDASTQEIIQSKYPQVYFTF